MEKGEKKKEEGRERVSKRGRRDEGENNERRQSNYNACELTENNRQ